VASLPPLPPPLLPLQFGFLPAPLLALCGDASAPLLIASVYNEGLRVGDEMGMGAVNLDWRRRLMTAEEATRDLHVAREALLYPLLSLFLGCILVLILILPPLLLPLGRGRVGR